MDKIRVLQCIETISSGGVEQTRLTLAKNLSKVRFEIKMTCSFASGPIAEALQAEGVELIPLGSMKHPFDWNIHRQVQAIIREFNPHIMHGGVFEGNSLTALSGTRMRVPIRIMEETSDPQNRSRKANWLLRQYSRMVDKVTAISPNVERYLLETACIARKKVLLINNGVPIPGFISETEKTALQHELGIDTDTVVVGFVGRFFNDHKRMTDLLDAISFLKKYSFKVLMVGDGRDRLLVERKIKELGISDRVALVGYQPNTDRFYSVMDIFCVPSIREGFGLVAAEAMLQGLPVIASRVGGLQDIVLDRETGYLIPPISPESLAEKIRILIEQPELRQEMGEKGRERALAHFSAERYCMEVENLYLELLEKKGIGKRE
ncbi:glycosyltransferase family 4 protein [Algoriphagus aestuariicola]|uniref:Glycosyltransferase family 4 protein n=1 Tax=Algoriphagus aestuariicola TaxID=1852016 RepID=A0ABS3BLN7_9BACT|nr:glycosyltransferase family 4 protein [Algoriphagus aestuariicola]MBN7800192.1 glycosyltransferase family 4 protein [Algoriphagus aestuariicola]